MPTSCVPGREQTNRAAELTIPNHSQKYSIFLPVHRLSRAVSHATSIAKETVESQSPKDSNTRNSRSAAAAAAALNGKRRSTMNSRDAAYDEEEQLRRAIEASRGETADEDSELTAASRRPKRTRDDSEEYVADPIMDDVNHAVC